MATLSVSGDNSSYTITLSGMSTSTRYHVFIADLNSSGSVTGYKCIRSSLGSSSTWTYNGSSNSPYSNYSRSVYVYTSTAKTSHSVGTIYTYDQMRKDCTFMDSNTIPAAGGGSGGSKILTVGSWPSILSSVSVTSGTFTSNNNAIPFSKTQYIESIQLTNEAKSNYWTGTLYWGTSSGSTTYKIATIHGGNVTYNSSIESIDYSGSSRSIYFTAVGSYCYRVRYNANGGSFSSTTANFRDDFVEQTDNDYSYAGTFSNDISRSGYRLLGWSKSSSATSAQYGKTDSIGPITSNNVNLYATWASNTCSLVFDYNGGRYGEQTGTTTISVIYGNTFTISRVPSKDGYSFLGWKRTADGIIYQDGESFTISNEKEILTAQWGIKCYFKLAAQSEGITSYQIYKRGSLVLSSNNTTWDETNSVYFSNTDIAEINVTLKSIYNGSTLVNANGFEIPTITAYKNTSLSSPKSDKLTVKTEGSATIQPTYKNYSIDTARKNGWIYFSITSSPKYYSYKIYSNDGAWSSGTDPQQGSVKSTEQLNLANFKPTRSGYVQLGWHTLSTAALPSDSYPLSGSIYLTGGLTLYAIWTKKYYIIFDANGGKWSNRASTTKPCEAYYKKVIYLGDESAGDTQRLSRGGHKLGGWSDTSQIVMKYLPGERFECPNRTENLNMYAIWDKQTIDKFYWYTNDTQDNTYIAEGKPITNLKASSWNRLKDKIEEIAEAIDISLPNSYSPTRVDSTTEISAQDYNGIRSAIINFPGAGTGPKVAAKDMVIGASMFVGTTSLKGAINRAIDQWNNS